MDPKYLQVSILTTDFFCIIFVLESGILICFMISANMDLVFFGSLWSKW